MSKASGSIDLSSIKKAYEDSSKVATNYVTNIDSNGIWVTPSGKKPTNTSTGADATGAKIDGTGVGIYVGGTKLAQYGTTTYFYEPDGTTAATLDGTGLNIKTGTITLGTNFSVTSTGVLTATGANLLTATIGNATSKISLGTGTSGNSALWSGMTTLASTSNGFYLGTDGIALGGGKFKVTADGTITATGLQIGQSQVNGLTTALNGKAASGAENTALSYLYYKDATNGLYIAKSVTQGTIPTSNYVQLTSSKVIVANTSNNRAEITSDGMQVYKDGNIIAKFGDSIILGDTSSTDYYNLRIDKSYNNGIRGYYNEDAPLGALYFNDDGGFKNVFLVCYSGSSSSTSTNAAALLSMASNGTMYLKATAGAIMSNMLTLETGSVHTTGQAGLYHDDMNGFLIRMYTVSGASTTAVGHNDHATRVYGSSCWANKAWSTGSDIRLKEKLKPLCKDTDDILLNLDTFTHEWKDKEEKDDKRHFGVSAQNVISIMKEHGYNPDDHEIVSNDGEYYNVAYTEFIPMLIHLCQSQQKKINDLEERLSKLEEKLELI